MSAQEFLQKYLVLRQHHEKDWEDRWQKDLLPFFGDYYLDLRSQSDPKWAVMPEITDAITEDDDTISFIVNSEGHHTKRYFVSQNKDQFKIERIMIECDLCNGEGKILQMDEPDAELEECPLCDGRGWDDWLD